jgi:hypothetical protein
MRPPQRLPDVWYYILTVGLLEAAVALWIMGALKPL